MRAVAPGALDDLLGDFPAQGDPCDDIATVVNARPDAGLGGLVGQLLERGGVTWEQIPQGRRHPRREAAVCGWIARMVRRGEQGLEGGIQLEWPHGPVGVLGVPAGDVGIVEGDARDGIGAGGARRVGVEPIFE